MLALPQLGKAFSVSPSAPQLRGEADRGGKQKNRVSVTQGRAGLAVWQLPGWLLTQNASLRYFSTEIQAEYVWGQTVSDVSSLSGKGRDSPVFPKAHLRAGRALLVLCPSSGRPLCVRAAPWQLRDRLESAWHAHTRADEAKAPCLQ